MIQNKYRLCTHYLPKAIASILIIAGITTTAFATERRSLWESRDQFVALEPQEPTVANDHPADIELNRLTALLGSINIRPAADSEISPLLTKESLNTLAPYLQQGLRQAKPGEDVIFAVIGLHSALYGLTRQPMVTTGRLFIKDGRFNLIIGLAQQEVNEKVDRRLAPFTPGSRQLTATGKWLLQTPTEPPGIALIRRDWVVADINWLPLSPSFKETPARSAIEPAARLTILNNLKEKGLITDEEYRDKRREIIQGL